MKHPTIITKLRSLALIILCTSCVTRRGTLFEKQNRPVTKPFCGEKYQIKDLRPMGKVPSTLNVPVITFKGDHGLARPPVPEHLTDIFDKAMVIHCDKVLSKYVYEIQIHEAYVAFEASLTKETEIVTVRLSVLLYNEQGAVIREWSGERTGEKESLDASDKSVLNMLNHAYATVFVDALYGLGMAQPI
jgi:hypothetical protein